MIPSSEVAVLDANAAALGVPQSELMENAGKAVSEVIIEHLPQIQNPKSKIQNRVVFLCGEGNNGGDGYVAARCLLKRKGLKIAVAAVHGPEGPKTEIARQNYRRLLKAGVKVRTGLDASGLEKLLEKGDTVVDALLGTGLNGPIREPYRSIAAALNRMKGVLGLPVVSVDVPSGFGGASGPMVHADITVTLHDVKAGMTEANSGTIIVRPIGIPAEAGRFVGPGEFLLLPRPAPDGHKGDRGSVLVVGGGLFTGAPALAALAAYRSGVDLARIAAPGTIRNVLASYSPCLIVHPLTFGGRTLVPQDIEEVLPLVERSTALVVGPGLGADTATLEAVRELLRKLPPEKPVLIDADGITAVAGEAGLLRGRRCVLTPHSGEFERLTGVKLPPEAEGIEGRGALVREWARRFGTVLLVKGKTDIVTDGERLKFNRTGNAAMAVGGTGDVLSGICGAFLARGVAPYDAARMAAYLSGAAGDAAFGKVGFSLLPTDVIEAIPGVLHRVTGWWCGVRQP